MKVGDLVKYTAEFPPRREPDAIGVIIEIQKSDNKDYRLEDSFLVLWSDGYEWIWKSHIARIK